MTSAALAPVAKSVVPANYWPKGGTIGPKFVNKVMPWVENFWHQHKRYPSPGDFIDRWNLSLEQIELLNQSKFWLQALDRRGITRPSVANEELSDRQIAAIAVLTNFGDGRSEEARLASLKVTQEELQGWYSNPEFKKQLASRAEDVFHNIAPEANVALARAIKRGNFQAVKFYMEITGKAQTPEMQNLRLAMQHLVEAVQKHVKDPEVLQAIGAEMEALRSMKGL